MKTLGLAWLVMLGLAAAFAPIVFQDPYAQDVSVSLQAPSPQHWFGTDALGRDLLSRVVYGARISLLVGIASALLALFLGTLVGSLSAYAGGVWDQLLMRGVDVWYSFPSMLILVLLKEMLERGNPERGLWAIVLALALYSWMHVARIVRGEILRLRELPFTEAARSLGASHLRILGKHLIPNTWEAIVITLMLRIPLAISAEATLGFVGLGVKAPLASWGTLASEGWSAMRFYPHLIVFPSLFLLATVMALSGAGTGLQRNTRQSIAGN